MRCLLLVVVIFTGCGGASSPTLPTRAATCPFSTSPTSPNVSMNATIDGVPWAAACLGFVLSHSSLVIVGTDNALDAARDERISIQVGTGDDTRALAPGTYSLLMSITKLPDGSFRFDQAISWAGVAVGCHDAPPLTPCSDWFTLEPGGTVTVTSVTSSSAAGTFSFRASVDPASPSPADGTKMIANGRFSVMF
jgi:hypothetical protein